MRLLENLRTCAGCNGPRGPLCPGCRALLAGPGPRVRREVVSFPVCAAATYAGPVREALVAFKDHGRWSLRDPLGAALGLATYDLLLARLEPIRRRLREAGLTTEAGVLDDQLTTELPVGDDDLLPPVRVLLVPAPSAPDSLRGRDGHHVLELALRVERIQGARAVEAVDGLVVVRRRRDQVGLGRAERAANLAGSMRATDTLVGRAARPGTAVVLVDDIVTTGATLAEAHRALLAAGIRPWGGAVVAATPDLPRRGVPRARPRGR